MTIYLDLIFLLNTFFDMALLMTVNILLKRFMNFKRIIFGSLFGGLSVFLLFLPLNSLSLFFLKIIISIIMLLISFGYQNKNYFVTNMQTLYFTSIILGGFLYFLNQEFSQSNQGLIFINSGLSVNVIFLLGNRHRKNLFKFK